jgi:hypothetical protein
MASLLRVAPPANQPTLNPKVQTAPVQSAPLRVAPLAAPQPARLPVVSQPANQQPRISVQAPMPQPDIKVNNAYRFVRLGQAVKEKFPGVYDNLDDGALGKIVAERFPGVYDQFIDSATPVEESKPKDSNIRQFLSPLIGGAKQVGEVLNTVSGVGQKVLNKLTGGNQQVAQISPELLKSQNAGESIGKGIAQVAEFLIPGGAVAKAGKAADAGIEGLNLGRAATGALKLGAKAGLSAGEAAGVTALQGGDKSDIKTAAVMGGAFSIAAKGVEKIINKVPDTAWTSILKRSPTDTAKNPLLPKQAAQTGLTGLTRQSIATKAERAIQSIEVTLDDLLSKSKGTINSAKVAGYLNDLRTAYAAIPGEQFSVGIIDDIASQLLESFKHGKAMTVLEANQLKRDIYSVIAKSYGKGAFEIPAKVEAQKIIAAGLKREIEAVIPEVKSLNQKQAVYIQIKKALDKTIARTEGKGIAGTGVGLYDLLLGGIGTGFGAVAGNPALGVGLVITKKTAESPIVLSATAKLLNHFNQLSPTKKILFYQALKGLTVKGGTAVNGTGDSPTR